MKPDSTQSLPEQPRIIATIEARMTSSRLPGKVLMEAGGRPLLQIMVERVLRSRFVHGIVIACTDRPADDAIVSKAEAWGIPSFRGSEENVLERVLQAGESQNADILVELTGDCPLIDPELIDDAIEGFLSLFPNCRYVSNTGPDISIPWGMDVEVFTLRDLAAIYEQGPDDLDREHVSYPFYRKENREAFSPYFIKYIDDRNRPDLRITLDYPQDYELIKHAYEELSCFSKEFGVRDVIHWLDAHPGLRDRSIEVRKAENSLE